MASTDPFWLATTDYHTAGEPFRIVPTESLPASSYHRGQNESVAALRRTILATPDHPLDVLRKTLCHEPRGHADMYGCFVVPADASGHAHFGALFWHKDGFSTACGHGTIALGFWAVERGLVGGASVGPGGDSRAGLEGTGQAKGHGEEETVDVRIDVPSGMVVAGVTLERGTNKPVHADFINVESYQLAKDVPVHVTSRSDGKDTVIAADLSFGGAVYACVDATTLGLAVEPRNHDAFVALGRQIKAALGERARHGEYDLYGVVFFDEEGKTLGDDANPEAVHQRNVTVFADGQVDRSPCGSGTCARLAVLLAQGRIGAGRSKLLHRSIVGTEFVGDIVSVYERSSSESAFPRCIPRVRGGANLVGHMNFHIDPGDPVYPGFLFR